MHAGQKWLLCDAAALRHCCLLLHELELATQGCQEMAIRLLARAHLEAWLVGLYIHYGGFKALERVAQDTRYNVEALDKEAKHFDEWLRGEQRSARRRGRKVEPDNEGIAMWNKANPEALPKPLLDPPYVPQLQPTGLDLTDRIAAFGHLDARPLPVSEIVDALTKLGPVKGMAMESFRPLYLIYQVISSIGMHATLNILDAYFVPGRFIRAAPVPVDGAIGDAASATALYGTAFLTKAVLGDQQSPTPVADEIRAWLMPDPSGRSAWAPGI